MLSPMYYGATLDCEQSLFSSKTVGKTQNKRGNVTTILTALPLVSPMYYGATLDCEQSLFSSKTVGKTQNKRGNVTTILTALPLEALAS